MSEAHINSQQFSTMGRSIPLRQIAELIGATLKGDGEQVIDNVGTIQSAKNGQIAFLNNNAQYHKYRQHLNSTSASALITTQDVYDQETALKMPVLIHPSPRKAIVEVIHLLFPKQTFTAAHHQTVVIGEQCDIHPNTHIGPNVVIGNRVKIGEHAIIQANSVILDNVSIGKRTHLFPNVTIYHGCQVGDDCVLHSNVVIGSDGFGFERKGAHWMKVPQIGGVVIGNRVEIGAGTTIDRGALDNTEISDDVILDNLIQIGHNVKVGSGTAIAACVGIAGSTEIGSNCLIGGATNFNGHIKITDGVSIVGCSNVAKSITEPGAYGGPVTVTDMRAWKKNLMRFQQLDKIANRLTQLESQLEAEKEA